jgi:hypothetical protein
MVAKMKPPSTWFSFFKASHIPFQSLGCGLVKDGGKPWNNRAVVLSETFVEKRKIRICLVFYRQLLPRWSSGGYKFLFLAIYNFPSPQRSWGAEMLNSTNSPEVNFGGQMKAAWSQ